MKRLYRRAGLAIGLLAGIASVAYIASFWRTQDLAVFASPAAVAAFGAAIPFYLIGVVATAWAWRRLLSDVGVASNWRELAGILAVTQIGKYLPGNVAQHVGRATISLGRGIKTAPLVVTVSVEMLLLMLASVVIGATSLLLSGRSLSVLPRDRGTTVVLAVVLVAFTLAGLLVARRIAPRLIARYAPAHAGAFNADTLPSARGLAAAFAIYCLVYVIFGTGIALMARLLAPAAPQDAFLLIGSFALAWIVGFATPGAPAGFGVREGVMLLLLGSQYSGSVAAAIVVGLRIVTTLGDVLLLPIGYLLLPKRNDSLVRG